MAYFSASGVTAEVAKKLASAVGGDVFEIVPKELYTKADLNWMNKKSRSSVEMADRNSRPEIASKVDDMGQFDTVFVGFPVWWYREPSIIDTFIESYDFSGKKIIPFCTSGSSGIGDSAKYIQELASGATVIDGKRFSKRVSESDLKEWAEQII